MGCAFLPVQHYLKRSHSALRCPQSSADACQRCARGKEIQFMPATDQITIEGGAALTEFREVIIVRNF